jgi:membrane-associated phospholipid phosphatase
MPTPHPQLHEVVQQNQLSPAPHTTPDKNSTAALNRRRFLAQISGLTAVTLAAEATGQLPSSVGLGSIALAEDSPEDLQKAGRSGDPKKRANAARTLHKRAATAQRRVPLPDHPINGDEERYGTKIGSFSKTLPHNALGEVTLDAYAALLAAVDRGDTSAFETIPLGGTAKLANPQAAYTFGLEGGDSYHFGMPAPPAFASAEQAGELAELYWQALTRDIPFVDYATDPLIRAAAVDLSAFSVFRGPKQDAVVTSDTLFRGPTPGDLTGPYLSQFLWKDIPSGAMTIVQRYRTTVAGDDHLTEYAEWLHVQNGGAPRRSLTFDITSRYPRNGRDLGEYVHWDYSYQAFLNAALLLLSFGAAAWDDGNPYKSLKTQGAFSTFGGPYILDLVARVSNAALQAAWCQKWLVHRRLRPEEFAGRLHHHKTGAGSYPISPEVLNSPVLEMSKAQYGSYLLPMGYPEGCPTHPAYPAGHAAIAGACVTVLKAFFKETFILPNPVIASADGLALLPYSEASLTVGRELNKLASNISLGRDTAGLHWRSDGIEGLKLGEAVALRLLMDWRETVNEEFAGFSLTQFDGTTITV